MSEKHEPLFVKIDGYRIVLRELEAIKKVMDNAKDALDVLRQLRDVKEQTLSMFMENVENLNTRLDSIARELPDVESSAAIGHAPLSLSTSQPTHAEQAKNVLEDDMIEGSIRDLHSELQKLKEGLKDIQTR